MKTLRLVLLLVGAALTGALIASSIRPVQAQVMNAKPMELTTASGYHLEEIQVGTTCVVIVSRNLELAATPCAPVLPR